MALSDELVVHVWISDAGACHTRLTDLEGAEPAFSFRPWTCDRHWGSYHTSWRTEGGEAASEDPGQATLPASSTRSLREDAPDPQWGCSLHPGLCASPASERVADEKVPVDWTRQAGFRLFPTPFRILVSQAQMRGLTEARGIWPFLQLFVRCGQNCLLAFHGFWCELLQLQAGCQSELHFARSLCRLAQRPPHFRTKTVVTTTSPWTLRIGNSENLTVGGNLCNLVYYCWQNVGKHKNETQNL